ncbi:MAG: response regulator transcription factor [Chloroflexota bacterium]|nr:response regulator transcription factor [Chloroflexota bacterium]
MTRIRVAIVDDHPALREGTAALLKREPDIEIVAMVGSLAETRALIEGVDPPDVVVQDIRLGDESGLRMLTGERSTGERSTGGRPGRSRPAIILWTAYDYPQYAAFAYRAGAAGFVVKTAPTAELVEAIRRVAAGGLHFGSRPDLDTLSLSGRERDVLERVVEGRSNDEIGVDLGVTTRTVEAHLTRLFERCDVRSRTELATRAIREGWLDVPSTAG